MRRIALALVYAAAVAIGLAAVAFMLISIIVGAAVIGYFLG